MGALALGEPPGGLQMVGMCIVGAATFALAAKKAGVSTLKELAEASGTATRWLVGGGGGGGGKKGLSPVGAGGVGCGVVDDDEEEELIEMVDA